MFQLIPFLGDMFSEAVSQGQRVTPGGTVQHTRSSVWDLVYNLKVDRGLGEALQHWGSENSWIDGGVGSEFVLGQPCWG
jgi:hypothetical protein